MGGRFDTLVSLHLADPAFLRHTCWARKTLVLRRVAPVFTPALIADPVRDRRMPSRQGIRGFSSAARVTGGVDTLCDIGPTASHRLSRHPRPPTPLLVFPLISQHQRRPCRRTFNRRPVASVVLPSLQAMIRKSVYSVSPWSPGTRCSAAWATRVSNCILRARAKMLSVMIVPASMFRLWAASVKLAEVMRARWSSMTTHLAWRQARV